MYVQTKIEDPSGLMSDRKTVIEIFLHWIPKMFWFALYISYEDVLFWICIA